MSGAGSQATGGALAGMTCGRLVIGGTAATPTPAAMPAAQVGRMNREINRLLAQPAIKARFAEVGAEPVGNTPEEMAQWMKEDTERWRQVIKNGGVTID